MDINNVSGLITNVGFPIACVLGMGAFILRLYKDSVQREAKLETQITESRNVNAKAIDTIARYAEKLDTIQQDVKEIKNDITTILTKN